MIKINKQETISFLAGYTISVWFFITLLWGFYNLHIIIYLLLGIAGIQLSLLWGWLMRND